MVLTSLSSVRRALARLTVIVLVFGATAQAQRHWEAGASSRKIRRIHLCCPSGKSYLFESVLAAASRRNSDSRLSFQPSVIPETVSRDV
jgi:hypothetical protein